MTHRDAFLGRFVRAGLPVRPTYPGIRGWRGCDRARICAGFGFDWCLAVHWWLLGSRRHDDGGHGLAARRYGGGCARIPAAFGFDRHLVRLGKETRLGRHRGFGLRRLGLERLKGTQGPGKLGERAAAIAQERVERARAWRPSGLEGST
jgi:hypothetical protein